MTKVSVKKKRNIHRTNSGDSYVLIYGQKYSLSDFERGPVYYSGQKFDAVSWCGYYAIKILGREEKAIIAVIG